MKIQKATGIVLSSKAFGESDILATVITREYGKKKFIFKGLKKSKKRSLSASEPGTIINLVYYYHPERETSIINEFSIQKQFYKIRGDLDRIYHYFYILEVVEKTIGFNQEEPTIYDLLAAGLETLSKTEYIQQLTPFFVLHLLRYLGILPVLDQCSICNTHITGPFSLNMDDLRLVCSSCQSTSLLLNTGIIHFIHNSLTKKYISIQHADYTTSDILDLLFSLTLFIEHHFNIEIKSKQFVLDNF